jgi:site-specific DNA-methyltransferase (adenine-specific)
MKPYYSDDSCVIYLGDCRDIIPLLEPVDHVITDPPFSAYTHGNAKSNRGKGHGNAAIDFAAIDFAAIDALVRALGPMCARWLIATMDWRHIAALELCTPEPWEFVRFGVWVKTNPMPQISADRPANGWDGICYLHNKGTKKRWNGGGDHGNWIGPVVVNGDHPTGKPEPFIRKLVEQHTDSGETILDPFMGSGTTLVAAKRLGRKAIGIEINEQYAEVAARRLSQGALTEMFAETVPEAQAISLFPAVGQDGAK